MHIFFSGIGGAGIGPLALIAKQAGHEVSGSDKQDSQYIKYLKAHGITNVYVGQTRDAIAYTHKTKPIDWYVFSSALQKENPDHPELQFVAEHNIKHSKRDLLLNSIIKDKQLKLIGIAGTHGKTTTTAMTAYLFKALNLPVSHLIPAKVSFAEMGQYDPKSQYFVLEADEFDRNFLSFSPYMAVISGVAYDHHEIYPTEESYRQAFRDYIGKSAWKLLWRSDFDRLGYHETDDSFVVMDDAEAGIAQLKLDGLVNRRNAWAVITAVHTATKTPIDQLIPVMNKFPGVSRRMEPIHKHLYTDYAHTVEKIEGALQIAQEIAEKSGRKLAVVYEPLTNRRMHHTIDLHKNLFDKVVKLYWVPSYLAREDPNQAVLTPEELIQHLSPEVRSSAVPSRLDKTLKKSIRWHLRHKYIVVCLSGGGGNSLDEWLRKQKWGWF